MSDLPDFDPKAWRRVIAPHPRYFEQMHLELMQEYIASQGPGTLRLGRGVADRDVLLDDVALDGHYPDCDLVITILHEPTGRTYTRRFPIWMGVEERQFAGSPVEMYSVILTALEADMLTYLKDEGIIPEDAE